MRSAHITRRQAEGAFGVLDAEVSGLQEYVATCRDLEEFSIDALVQEVDRELATEEQAKAAGPQRRVDRVVLRVLTTRIDLSELASEFDGEVA